MPSAIEVKIYTMDMEIDGFKDRCVLYESEDEDGMWVAHSIYTDVIGMGVSPQTAFEEMWGNLTVQVAETKADPRIKLLFLAPADVRAKADYPGAAKVLMRGTKGNMEMIPC